MSGATPGPGRFPAAYRVGLTGNIAAGKSEVAAVWKSLGAEVVDADVLARAAVAPGTPGLAAIVDAFGPGVLNDDGTLDRAGMGRLAFADPEARRRLEAIVHPHVQRLRLEAEADAARRAQAEGRPAPIVVHDIPLLFETGAEAQFDEVVLVHAPVPLRLERLVLDRGLDPAEAEARMAAQMDPDEKLERADRVLINDGSLETLRARAAEIWRSIEEGK